MLKKIGPRVLGVHGKAKKMSAACAELSSCLIGASLAEIMKCVHLAHYCTPTIATTDTLSVTGLAA